MGPSELAGWLTIIKEVGPAWGILALMAATLYYSARRADLPSKSAEPMTRKDLEHILERLAAMEKRAENQHELIGFMTNDLAFIRGKLDLDLNRKA